MNKEEMIEKYGEIELEFSSYYKYSFSYCKYLDDGTKLIGSFGGSADDIYRVDVSSDSKIKVKDYERELTSLTIVKDGKTIFSYDDY